MIDLSTIFKIIFFAMILAIFTYKLLQFLYHVYINSLRPNNLFKARVQYLHPESSYYHTNYIIHSNLIFSMDTIDGHRLSIIKQIYNSDSDLSSKVERVRKILSNKERRNLNHILKQIYIVPIFSITHLNKIKSKSIFTRSVIKTHSNITKKFRSDTKVYLPETSNTLVRSYIMEYSIISESELNAHRYYIIIDLTTTQVQTSQYIFTQLILENILQILYKTTYSSKK